MNIVQSVLIGAEVPQVWRHIVTAELLSTWLMPPIDFKPNVGARFRFVSECDGRIDEIICSVLTVDLNRRFAFSWHDASIGLDSVVTIALESHSNDQTLVTLTQSGWRALSEELKYSHEATWIQILTELESQVVLQLSPCR